ncbi:flavoprotein [Streptomyces sp. NPDC008313]|uniref:flavoprotein n=1 Tax=Streptomyces sp. NPDC008313 TaxID=3364826 RepID=UPI0036EF72AD
MAENPPPPEAPAPEFGGRKVLFAGTGSLGVMFMPMWLNWLRTAYPDIEVRTVLTRSAQRFVTRDAVTAFAGGTVLQDVWPDEPEEGATHVQLAQWPDTVVVHPATYSFVSRLALGVADTPLLLALQCTAAPIAVAPALPPGGAESYGYRRHVAALAERPNVTVVPPQPGYSVTTGGPGATVATPLPAVIPALERLRARLAAGPASGKEAGR